MRFFRIKARTTPAPARDLSDGTPIRLSGRRGQKRGCVACGQVRGIYVYADNGRDYCLACARDLWSVIGLQPAGRRTEDVTLEELIQYEVGGNRAS